MATTSPFSLDGKKALVTGASRGLGWAMAQAMAEAGASVALNGRKRDSLERRVESLTAAGLQAVAAPFDVTDSAALAAGLESAVRALGGLDILVCNAGVVHRSTLADFSDEAWRRVIDTNLTACFALSREASKIMAAQGSGRIIMTGSIMGDMARPGVIAYVASKGGVKSMTRALAAELGPLGITCNAIAPGYITTDMTAALAADPAFDAMVKSRTPLGRWGEPRDIGLAAVYLASDAAAYVNGETLTVDGGMTAAL